MYIYIVAGIVALLYLYLKYHYDYWQRLGIPSPKPVMFFGNMLNILRLKKNLGQQMMTFYDDYNGYDFIGYYKFLTPAILLRSPELINKVLVRDFDHFEANDFEVGEHDEISSRNPFLQQGAEWKRTRNLITPAFTSGKLKSMVPFTLKASNNLVEYIASKVSASTKEDFDSKDLFSRYTTDNTASCAFGLEANSFDKNDTDFLDNASSVFKLDFKVAVKSLVIISIPKLAKILKLQFIDLSIVDYFRSIITKTVQYRKQTGTERNDFLNQMLQLKAKLGDKEFGDIDMLAHGIQIILNGVEASSATMSFMFYLLSTNLDVQEKARAEVDSVLKQHNGELTYDAIKEMTYLEQVLNETLRMYPAVLAQQKICTKAYTIPKTDKTPAVTIVPGTPVIIPTGAMHLDDKYFLNPKKFDPERFSPKNVKSIPKYAFLPFGDGPRICLGQRFATIQVKLGAARLLRDFEVTLSKNTVLPVVLSPRSFLNRSVDPIYLNFSKRA